MPSRPTDDQLVNIGLDDFLDGFALWQELKPQSQEDWIAVARRCLASSDYDLRKSSPRFMRLVRAVAELESAAHAMVEEFGPDAG